MVVFLPLLLFGLGTLLETLAGEKFLPSGTTISVFEISIILQLLFNLRRLLPKEFQYLFLAPLGILLGDFSYGISNYLLKLNFPNQLGALTYVVPYMIAMTTIAIALGKYLWHSANKNTFFFAIILTVAFFALNCHLIIYPALFIKQPPLSLLMQALTVLFTIIESAIVSFSAALLVLTVSFIIQLALFGVLITHISDIAIRYQSVDLKLLGMSVFENGWCFGLALMGTAVAMARKHNYSYYDKTSLFVFWRNELSKVMPFVSIRGFVVTFISLSLVSLWAALSLYNRSVQNPNFVSATLLIAIAVFSVAIYGANLLTFRLSEITLTLENSGELKLKSSSWGLPKEINVISSQYQNVFETLKNERDHALNLASKLAHDIRSPIAALSSVKSSIANSLATHPELASELEIPVHLLNVASGVIRELASDLLSERKRILDLEPIGQSLDRAVQLAKTEHPTKHIEFASESELPQFSIKGLTRVLTNIINNAAEASSTANPVLVSLQKHAADCVIKVVDSGPGIHPDVLKRLLNGGSVTTKANGNGIGVSSMLTWAKDAGIAVDIHSNIDGPRTGTTVSLTIPLLT